MRFQQIVKNYQNCPFLQDLCDAYHINGQLFKNECQG